MTTESQQADIKILSASAGKLTLDKLSTLDVDKLNQMADRWADVEVKRPSLLRRTGEEILVMTAGAIVSTAALYLLQEAIKRYAPRTGGDE